MLTESPESHVALNRFIISESTSIEPGRRQGRVVNTQEKRSVSLIFLSQEAIRAEIN